MSQISSQLVIINITKSLGLKGILIITSNLSWSKDLATLGIILI